MEQVSVKKEFFVKAVAYFELIGGVAGVLMTLVVFFRSLSNVLKADHVSIFQGFYVLILPVIFFCVFLTLLRAGMLLLRYDIQGFRLSILLQILQLPIIITPKLSYNFYAAAQVALGYVNSSKLHGLQFKSQVGSYYWLQFSSPIEMHGFFVNLLALCCLVVLVYFKSRP